jgi:hypothetical protein
MSPSLKSKWMRLELNALGIRKNEMIESPLVCIPDAIPREKRADHFALAKDLFVHRASVQEDLPDGYAVHFPSASYDAVAQFVSNERKCLSGNSV